MLPVHKVNININNNDQAVRAALIKEISNPTYTSAPALGSNKAKVTMVEFGDYQCHFCAAFQRNTKHSIIQNFVNTGQVRFLFKDFTINDKPGNKASTLAAEASYCAEIKESIGSIMMKYIKIQKAKMLLGLLKMFLNNLLVM